MHNIIKSTSKKKMYMTIRSNDVKQNYMTTKKKKRTHSNLVFPLSLDYK